MDIDNRARRDITTIFAKTSAILEKWELANGVSPDDCWTIFQHDDHNNIAFDLILLCNQRRFLAHRSIVFEQSQVLAHWARQIDSSLWVVDLPNIVGDTMDLILQYAYSKEALSTDLELPIFMDLLNAAITLEIKDLEQAIHQTLLKNVNTNYLVGLWDKCDLSDKKVTYWLHNYIIRNIRQLIQRNTFAKLSWQQYFGILTSSRLDNNVPADLVLDATMQWIHANRDRQSCALEIIPFIKWDAISPGCISYFMAMDSTFRKLFGKCAKQDRGNSSKAFKSSSTNGLNLEISECSDHAEVLSNPLKSNSWTSEDTVSDEASKYLSGQTVKLCEPPPNDVTLEGLSGYVLNKNYENIEKLSSVSSLNLNIFSPLPPTHQRNSRCTSPFVTRVKPNSELGSAVRENPVRVENEDQATECSIAISSPSNDRRYLSRFQRSGYNCGVAIFGIDLNERMVMQSYAFQWKTWCAPIELKLPFRRHFTTAFSNQKIIIAGGNDDRSIGSQCTFVYEVIRKITSPYYKLQQERVGAGTASHGDDIYVVGGSDKNVAKMKYLRSVERISTESVCPKWEQLKLMHYKRGFPGVVATTNRIYVIGGYTTSCEYFDIQLHTWVQMKSLPDRFRLSGIYAVRCNQQIFAFRRNDPADMVIVDLKTNAFHFPSGGGDVPLNIVGCGVMYNDIWAVDHKAAMFIFNPCRLIWKKSHIQSPGSPIELVLDAKIITQNDINDLCAF